LTVWAAQVLHAIIGLGLPRAECPECFINDSVLAE